MTKWSGIQRQLRNALRLDLLALERFDLQRAGFAGEGPIRLRSGQVRATGDSTDFPFWASFLILSGICLPLAFQKIPIER
jgi:hypothetical protein